MRFVERAVSAAMTVLIAGLCLAAAPAPREIKADMAQVKGARDMFWQTCVGAGHAALLLRAENQAHLRLIHDETGFTFVRFHGVLTDDMGVYREVDGKPVYDFSKVDAVYGAILEAGMKPFVELSFMPEALAIEHRPIFFWKANGSPPKDYGKWSDLIAAFTRHLTDRFGREEVESWRFEVWNEPNLDGFWNGANQAEYFRLYDTTARAIKAVDPALVVGGPATAGAAWVPDFLEHAQKAGVAADFVATHTYGVAGGFLDEFGKDDNKLIPSPDSIVGDVRRVRKEIEEIKPGLPLHFTEWSASYNPRDPVHDAYLSAAFILDKLKKSEGLAQSMSYWAYTDLFEEPGPPPTPFHGGFGLINREGIRKAAFFAYKYLNELGPQELIGGDAQSWVTRDGDDFAMLAWNFTTPDQTESNRPFFRKVHPAEASVPIVLEVGHLKSGTYRLSLHRTGYRANDAYSRYIDWGLPDSLTQAQVSELQRLSADTPEAVETVHVDATGRFATHIDMRTNDVVLVTLTKMK